MHKENRVANFISQRVSIDSIYVLVIVKQLEVEENRMSEENKEVEEAKEGGRSVGIRGPRQYLATDSGSLPRIFMTTWVHSGCTWILYCTCTVN